jgi:hypothetical protein
MIPMHNSRRLVSQSLVYGQVHFLPSGAFVHTTIAHLSIILLPRTKEPGRQSESESERWAGTTVVGL